MAGLLDLSIDQGSEFARDVEYSLNGVPVNMTGYTVRMMVRSQLADDSGQTVVDLNLGSGIAWVDQVNGKFSITVSALVTAGIHYGTYVYDLEVTPPAGAAHTFRLLSGNVYLSGEVTR